MSIYAWSQTILFLRAARIYFPQLSLYSFDLVRIHSDSASAVELAFHYYTSNVPQDPVEREIYRFHYQGLG